MKHRSGTVRAGALVALAAIAVGTLSSCGNSAEAEARSALDAGRDRWRRSAITRYSVEVRYQCFCPTEFTVRTRIEVRDGAVVAATPLDSLAGGVRVPLEEWHTVDELFAMIEAALDDDEPPTVVYDAELGYPRSGSFHCPANVTDCGFVFDERNLVRLD